jgi:hypothetical protein
VPLVIIPDCDIRFLPLSTKRSRSIHLVALKTASNLYTAGISGVLVIYRQPLSAPGVSPS